MALFEFRTEIKKQYVQGTHRTCSPADTLNKYHKISKTLGITRLANITGLDRIGMPVWVSIRPNSRGLSTAQGKGMDSLAAKASALMESIENWHAENIQAPLTFDSYQSLSQRSHVANIDKLATYSHALLRKDAPILWIEGYDLLKETPTWVPYDSVSTNYVTPPRGEVKSCFVISSNGLAGGNHLIEATIHGLCEVIERDAIEHADIAIRGGRPQQKLVNTSITDPDCQALLKQLNDANILVSVIDITSDIQVPTFSCTIVDNAQQAQWRSLPAFNGYGTHLNPAIAIMRAITEAVQSRLTYISGSRDDIFSQEYDISAQQDELKRHRELILGNPGERLFNQYHDNSHDTFNADLDYLKYRLKDADIDQAIIVDLSQKHLNIPVIKAVVPGLSSPSVLFGDDIRPVKRNVVPSVKGTQ